jgi:hypothetical protein
MDYNTQRKKLVLPEYGRGIQNMVDYAVSIADKEERQQCANTIISIMGSMFPHLRDVSDFKHKLWDHLAIMSDYKLDIDYPYEVMPHQKDIKPEPMRYPMKRIRSRHYGYYVENLLSELENMEEGEEKEALVGMVANLMKNDLFYWNNDAVDEERIAADIARYTHNKVHLDLNRFVFAPIVPDKLDSKQAKGKKKKGK